MAKSKEILQIGRVQDQIRTRALIRFDEHHAIANIDTRDLLSSPAIIDPKKYCPKAPHGIHKALPEIPSHFYIKYPRIRLWQPAWRTVQYDFLRKKFLREVKVCEILSQSPYYNLVTYHGCIIQDKLIRGICYSAYWKSLEDFANPGRKHGKRSFQYGQHQLKNPEMFIADLKKGVAHLHSLGLVHNDLKPMNLVLREEDESPVIIDFDSCVYVGEPLARVPRTPGWHDPSVRYARFDNDWHAVEEIRTWLSEDTVKRWKFNDY